jgi:ABC-type oligopeptide transport system substrate-binding subunit
MSDAHDSRSLLRLYAAFVMALALAACGDSEDSAPQSSVNLVNPAVSSLLSSVDAIGAGGSDLLSHNPTRADPT